jgi:hypothetical protein
MSALQALDPARLDKLRRRFNEAAYNFPTVDAVVVYRPDPHREEAERQARSLYVKPANPASEHFAEEWAEQTRGTHEAMRRALNWEHWVPPTTSTIGELGGQAYWRRIIRDHEEPEFCGPPAGSELWECTLFGLVARDLENVAHRRFNLLAADAARLILPRSKAKGTALLSRWLIYLADRDEPIVPDARRRYTTDARPLRKPMWVPVTPLNRPTRWWAVRLPNVFQLSRIAVEQALALAAAEPPTVEATSPVPNADVLGIKPHPDGPEGGRWLWWQNKRHKVPQGNVYRMIAYMWDRDSGGMTTL